MNREAIKFGILGASLETPNLGVSALATSAVGCILHAYPAAEVFFLDYGGRSTTRTVSAGPFAVQVPLVNIRFSKRFWLGNSIAVLLCLALVLRLLPLGSLRSWVTRRNRALHTIANADIYAAVSGGDSFSDIYGRTRFIYGALPQVLVLMLGKRLVLLPQTYGPFRGRWTSAVARWIVRHSEMSWCRDRNSLNELMHGDEGDTARGAQDFCYDMAFGLESYRPERLEVEGLRIAGCSEQQLIGINLSGLLWRGGYTGQNQFGLRLSYRELMRTLVEFFLVEPANRILLVPHVFDDGSGTESDVPACEELFAELEQRYAGRVGVLRGIYNANEIRYVIGMCGFFVGARMHACIAAVSQSIPAVCISYSDKFRGVMGTVGADQYVADVRQLTETEVLDIVHRAWKERFVTAARLQARMPAVRTAVWSVLNSTHYGSKHSVSLA